MIQACKRSVKRSIAHTSLLQQALNRVTGDFPKVFVYHRFSPAGAGKAGFLAADQFAWQLDQIRRHFRVITLEQCLNHFRNHGAWPRRSVIITVDDGYRDFYAFAFPELLKRDLSATFFVTVNFIDRKVWLWPDRLEYLLLKTNENRVALDINGTVQEYPLRTESERLAAWHEISSYCLILADDEKMRFLDALPGLLRVTLPNEPPPEYEAVTWEELRHIRGNGIEIGSHTITHPILSRLAPSRISEEVGVSKTMLEERLGAEVSTFCYPNSDPADINDTVVAAVKQHGYLGAVFGINLKVWDPYLVPRMGVVEDRDDFLWKLYGGEVL